MNDQKYYLQYKGEPWTGTSHQLYNLSVLLAEASILGRIAVLPDLTLAAHHNHGRAIRVPLSNYFDLSVFAAYVALITLPEFEQLNFSHPVWVDEKVPTRSLQGNPASLVVREFTNPSDVFSAPMKSDPQVEAVAAQMRSLVAPNQIVRSYAETAFSTLGQDFDTIHVRRGDLLQQAQQEWWRFPGFDRRTRPQGIRNRISAWSQAGRTLYIMTDELETGFFDPLKAWYKVYMFRDFPLFETLRTEDNYLLYEVEKYIASRARLQIEMFSQYGQNVNFTYCLLDYPRWGVNNRFSRSLEKCYRVFWSIKSWLKRYLRYLRRLARIS
ncbi:MAG: hypothetical protein MUF72_06585 [Elainella sp. Prado103]|nr:hypothetical protein [Elainella sp. Prado103]